jgi:succinyl-CoA synthetase beta subunit
VGRHPLPSPLVWWAVTPFLLLLSGGPGTNVKEAKALIEGAGYRMIMTDDLEDAAQKAVKIADIVRQANEISVGVTFELPL